MNDALELVPAARDLLLSDQTKIDSSTIDLGRFLSMIDKAPGTFPTVTR